VTHYAASAHAQEITDTMYPCIWLTCSVLFLLLRARVETLSVSIGAVFDAPEFDEYSSLFYHTFNDNRLLRNTSLNVTAFATPIDPNKSVYSSLLSLCSSIEGSDTRVILVIGTEDTVQRVSQVAQPLGIPMLALTTDSNVERHVQVKKTTYFLKLYYRSAWQVFANCRTCILSVRHVIAAYRMVSFLLTCIGCIFAECQYLHIIYGVYEFMKPSLTKDRKTHMAREPSQISAQCQENVFNYSEKCKKGKSPRPGKC